MKDSEGKFPMDQLDPGKRDPGFWLRFHGRVLADARDELARRRMSHDLSVVDVVFSWRQALVPMALMAAALAGFLLLDPAPQDPGRMVAVDELLMEDLNLFSTSGIVTGEELIEAGVLVATEGGF